jgi:hypothetical protein
VLAALDHSIIVSALGVEDRPGQTSELIVVENPFKARRRRSRGAR